MLSSKQREYLANCKHRWNFKIGATGSGKSWLDYAVVIPKRLFALRGEGAAVMLGNTQGTLSRNVLDPMREIWGSALVGTIGSDNTANLFGKKVHILGADNRKHVARLQGMTIEYAYGDEVTTWHEEVFQMLKSRLRCRHSFFDGTANPESPYHFLKAFLESKADVYCQTSTIDDNPFLPPEFVENLKQEYAGTVYYDRFVLGRWAAAGGLVYPFFSADDPRYVVDGFAPKHGSGGRYFVSIDYGTYNPCSMGLWCVAGGVATRFRESYYDGRKNGRQRTDEEHHAELERLTSGIPVDSIIIDPSAASFIETIRRHGRYRVRQAENDVLNGIRVTACLLSAGKMQIDRSCKDSLREFGSYRWDEKKHYDAVLKEHDHAMDDTRYFAATVLSKELRWVPWERQRQ